MSAEPVYGDLYERVWWLAVEADQLETQLWRRVEPDSVTPVETLDEFQQRVLGGPPPPQYLEAMRDRATSEERSHRLFPMVTSRFPDEALARAAVREFRLTEGDLKRLQQIHELRARSWLQADVLEPKKTVPVAIAAITLIATLLPRELFGSDDSYVYFRLGLLVVFVGALLSTLLVWLVIPWRWGRQGRRRAKLTKTLLDYCEIVVQKGEPHEDERWVAKGTG